MSGLVDGARRQPQDGSIGGEHVRRRIHPFGRPRGTGGAPGWAGGEQERHRRRTTPMETPTMPNDPSGTVNQTEYET